METFTFRRFRQGDEFAISDVICTTLAISNRKDYSPGFIEEKIRSHAPEAIAASAEKAHFYVAMDGETIIGCGGITGYWGSTEAGSSLTSVSFYQKMGYAFKNGIMDADEYGVVRLEKRKASPTAQPKEKRYRTV